MFHQLTDTTKALVFYSLAFGLAVLVALLAPLIGQGAAFLTMFAPLIAVLLMLLVVTRDGYSRAGWRSLGLHRAGLRGWPLALLGPILVLGCTYVLAWRIGVGRFVPPADGAVDMLLNLLIDLAIGGLIGGLGEEIGWRGYFLPHLLTLGRRRALLLSGLFHGVWHMPLLLLTPFYHGLGDRWIVVPLFLLTLTVAGIFYGYLRLTTDSVWPVALAHSSFNAVWELLSKLTIAVSPLALEYLAGETGVFTLVGTAIVAGWLVYRLDRRATRSTMQAEQAAREKTVYAARPDTLI